MFSIGKFLRFPKIQLSSFLKFLPPEISFLINWFLNKLMSVQQLSFLFHFTSQCPKNYQKLWVCPILKSHYQIFDIIVPKNTSSQKPLSQTPPNGQETKNVQFLWASIAFSEKHHNMTLFEEMKSSTVWQHVNLYGPHQTSVLPFVSHFNRFRSVLPVSLFQSFTSNFTNMESKEG